MGYITLEQDSDGIVELIFDQPGKTVNTMGSDYQEAMTAAVAELKQRVAGGGVKGVYVRSGKPGQFFAGGDIKEMLEMDLNIDVAEKQRMYDELMQTKQPLRDLELLGVPRIRWVPSDDAAGSEELRWGYQMPYAITGYFNLHPRSGIICLQFLEGGCISIDRLATVVLGDQDHRRCLRLVVQLVGMAFVVQQNEVIDLLAHGLSQQRESECQYQRTCSHAHIHGCIQLFVVFCYGFIAVGNSH